MTRSAPGPRQVMKPGLTVYVSAGQKVLDERLDVLTLHVRDFDWHPVCGEVLDQLSNGLAVGLDSPRANVRRSQVTRVAP